MYIDSNSGQSSGGHSALLLGDRVYHLQYSFEDQIFHIVRENWNDFRFQYGVIENRNIEFYKWNLSPSAKQTLRQKWNELYLVQETHIQNQKILEEDSESNESYKKEDYFQNTRVGFGYFTSILDPNSPIPKQFHFQKEEFKNINEQLAQLKLNILEKISSQTSESIILPDTSSPLRLVSTIQTSTNQMIQWERKFFVRKFLQNPVLLYEQAFVTLEGKEFNLTNEEILIWKRYQSKLIKELKSCILSNECQDWEELTLLLRVLYLQKSIDDKQIVFPKKNFTGFSYLEFTELPSAVISTKQKEYASLFLEKRKDFLGGYHPIQFYNWETFLSHYQSFMDGKTYTEGIEFNWVGKNPYLIETNKSPNTKPESIITHTKNQAKIYTKKIRQLYSYNLVFQNCTNELFYYLNLMFPEGNIGGEQFWDPLSNSIFGLNFIPSVAAKKLSSNNYTKEIKLYPSYRNLKRNNIKDWEEKYIVERFVPTSKIYRSNPMDHSFLFFTEESIWSRPVLGFANVVYGLGYTGIGFIKSPIDKGRKFSEGTETIFYSIPELFFFNIRKGHFPLIAAEEIPEEYYQNESQ
ncbi:hypothetical protein LPTSP2_19880 [Leptospira ellinghausenii]|uniref:DUF4105 domain-containing protein n=1 Tax=Leptospira ellinghausenii TaxID=1917822 RepID=A0A2P2DDM8_9LEPT|nr:hypothetical protein [Leptospira ellinghausenii]GBF42698.1 hypothetical protein LPTSP2_19880 [Leptospira ellinghausenii]